LISYINLSMRKIDSQYGINIHQLWALIHHRLTQPVA